MFLYTLEGISIGIDFGYEGDPIPDTGSAGFRVVEPGKLGKPNISVDILGRFGYPWLTLSCFSP